ncbi:MAG: ABC transporter permease [Lentimicrobiaceae bacterium]|jgi:putative ABC transport system permease protein
MIRSYLKTAWRNLIRNPKISAINIGGLAIGLACTIILYLYASSEFGYDGYYKNADRIYRAYTHISLNGAESNSAKSSPPLAETLRTQFPEVESNTLVGYENAYDVRYKDKTFREYRIYTADSNYFKVFDHPVIKGNASEALSMPNEVVITETTAKRYFGDADPVGKQLLLNDTLALMVTAVMTDFPENSHFNADMLMSMSTLRGKNNENWLALGYSNFVMLKKGTDVKAMEQKLNVLVDKSAGPQIEKLLNVHYSAFKSTGNTFEMKLQPLREVYLYSKERYGIDPNTEWGHSRTGNILYVRIFIASALFVLLIAIFNFMNIATARSEKQAKETGIRKTLGSARWQLMIRYFTESMMTTGISVIIALCIVYATLPWFNQLIGKTAKLNLFENIWSIPILLLFTMAVGIFAGSYPAIFLSAFQPVETLKGLRRKNKTTLRSILVVSQFAISIAMIIGMMAVKSQLNYMQHKNLGIKPDQLITITNGATLGNNLQAFRQELLKNPAITSVTNSSLIFASGVPESAYSYENQTKTEPPIQAAYLDVDESFIKTFGIELKEGRFFDPSMPTDSNTVVINETAAKDFAPNVKSIIGHNITMLSNRKIPMIFRVIGVTKDFNFESLHQKVKPLVLHLDKVQQAASYITIKFSGNNPESILTYTESIWDKVNSIEKANCSFLNDTIESLYSSEKRISTLSTILSILGILVACLGLFGLAMFVTEQRKKEIGIRKILGAGVAEVTATISKQFVLWIAIANLIAWPVAYFVLHQWLQNFAYNIKPAWWMFAGAGFITLFIALATISILSVKAALANPVKSLRTE